MLMPDVLPEALTVRSPAKVNLFLEVTGRRPDGYHELFSLMCPVGLYDTLVLTIDKGPGIRVSCDHPEVPEDAGNLAVRAAALFRETVFSEKVRQDRGIHIRIDKQIPVGAGLGGGSSNAAAVLTALNHHYQNPLSTEILMELGTRLGADVPFFVLGRPALATGIGEHLAPVTDLPARTLVLVYPDVSVSTAWVYKNLKIQLTKDPKKLKKSNFKSSFFRFGTHLVNDLEPVTEAAFPVIQTAKQLLLANGAEGALMSGSGSTVFGVFSDPDAAVSAYRVIQDHPENRNWTLYIADLLV